MKVYMRSYKIQTVLIVMGSIMCTASTLEAAIRRQEALWLLGLLCLGIGILSWLWIQVDKALKARQVRRRRETSRKAAPQAQSSAQAARGPVKRGF